MVEFLPNQIQALARFLPDFERSDFAAGQMPAAQQNGDGSHSLPCVIYANYVSEFEQAADQHTWVLPHFDWPQWTQTAECRQLCDDHAVLANAKPEQLAKLPAVLIRQERFCGNALLYGFNSGLILRIVHRIAAFAQGVPSK